MTIPNRYTCRRFGFSKDKSVALTRAFVLMNHRRLEQRTNLFSGHINSLFSPKSFFRFLRSMCPIHDSLSWRIRSLLHSDLLYQSHALSIPFLFRCSMQAESLMNITFHMGLNYFPSYHFGSAYDFVLFSSDPISSWPLVSASPCFHLFTYLEFNVSCTCTYLLLVSLWEASI